MHNSQHTNWFFAAAFATIALVALFQDLERFNGRDDFKDQGQKITWVGSAIICALGLASIGFIMGLVLRHRFMGNLLEFMLVSFAQGDVHHHFNTLLTTLLLFIILLSGFPYCGNLGCGLTHYHEPKAQHCNRGRFRSNHQRQPLRFPLVGINCRGSCSGGSHAIVFRQRRGQRRKE